MHEDDGVIDFQEFCVGIGLGLGCLDDFNAPFAQIIESDKFKKLSNTMLIKNLFCLFDTNDDGVLNFRELLLGFSSFQNETFDQQIKQSFRLFDPEEQGYVTKSDLTILLTECLEHLAHIPIDSFGDGFIEQVMKETFEQAVVCQ